MKFEIGNRLFENFRKLEDGVSKFSKIPIFGRNQINEPLTLFVIFFSGYELYPSLTA